ncbi:MAG: right-handed parallel beta-helix repeat-containing protein, partial [Phycisphaerae bacterium]|nr:right-handed parallel beta-helix repeat-containing protein [Phycisphaerae bacterium]
MSGKQLIVNSSHPKADDQNPGDDDAPFATINAAAQAAQPGDTVLVSPGVYREWVRPARGGTADAPIVYKAAEKGGVIVKGSDVFEPQWACHESLGDVWTANLPQERFTYRNPYTTGESISGQDHNPTARPHEGPEFPLTLGQVVVHGRLLVQVERHEQLASLPGTWMVSPDGESLWLHLPEGVPTPAKAEIELSVRHRIFSPIRRGLKHIHVRGFVFEHCANQGSFPQAGAVSLRSGSHWRIEDNTIRLANSIGLDIGFEFWEPADIPDVVPEDECAFLATDNLIRGNNVVDNGLCGIAGIGTLRTSIVGNVIERNNALGHTPNRGKKIWEEEGGIKTHAMAYGLIEGNLVRNNDGPGIWIDNGFTHARITRNVVIGNLRMGVFLELGSGPVLVDNNFIGHTRMGDGFYSHDAARVTVTHNTFFGNGNWGVWCAWATDRRFRCHVDESGEKHYEQSHHTGWRIRSNLFVGNRAGTVSLPLEIPGKVEDNRSDHNLFLGGGMGTDISEDVIYPLFQVNHVHRKRTREDVAEAMVKALAKAGWDREQMPNPAFYKQHLLLSLEMWQAFTGNDRHSHWGKTDRPNLSAL